MRFTSIPATEKNFRTTGGNGQFSFSTVDVPIPGEDLRLNAVFAKSLTTSGYFHAVEHPKRRIVIHYTAGNLAGDMPTMSRDDFHVSVPFVIARDGTIYQLFPSKFWSGHLGPGIGNQGTGNAQDKCTIGIELSNYGYLVERQGNLETIYSRLEDEETGKIGPIDVYCSLADEDAYQKISQPFREQTYYATHTDAQYESLIILLRYLTAAWNIPREFLPESTRYLASDDVLDFRGIVSHVNYRQSGKWDIGPAFDWEQVIAGVQASAFESQRIADRSAIEITGSDSITMGVIQSEDALVPLLPATRDAAHEDDPYDEAGEPTSEPPRDRQVYALLVGINAYEENLVVDNAVRFPVLNGCVSDARKIETFLANQAGIDAHIEVLTDKEATKAEIVRQFRAHLGQAGPDDTALFYFSGHGTQEWADVAWDEETDGKLECLACYYDTANTNFLLADKELRYLIHELWKDDKKPHIVTLFDCCHSGDNTRAAAIVEAVQADFPEAKPVEKAIPYVFSKRDWSRFVFADSISLTQLQQHKTAKTLPEGVHVQMAACEAHEPAVEVGGEGVFTKVLTNVLQTTAGSITYHDLQSRVRAYLRNVYKQQPRFRVAGGSAGMIYRTFLGGSEQQEAGLVGNITHNKAGWSLDKGAIQGIGTDHQIILGVANDRVVLFQVQTIFPDYTTLEPADHSPNPADTDLVYKSHITGLMAQKIRVSFELEDVNAGQRAQLMTDVLERMKNHLTVVDKADDVADYVVRGRKGQYYLTYPVQGTDSDDSMAYRPLVLPIETAQDDALDVLASDLRHVARWEYIRQLENQNTQNQLPRNPLLIEIWRQNPDGNEEKLTADSGVLPLNFKQNTDGEWVCPLRFRITNQSVVDLYVSALYLSMGFESYLSLLPDDVFTLERGKSIELTYADENGVREPLIGFQMNEIIPLYNWPERVEYLKFIVSTDLFTAAELQLDPLELPLVLNDERGAVRGDAQGRGPGQIKSKPKPKGWTTQRIDMHWKNPTYNQIDPATIEAMQHDENLADFALGLYFENKTDEVVPRLELKSVLQDLTSNVPLREKGLLGDLGLNAANWFSRKRRNNRYEKAIRRNPDALRIVSEGDSWFQHPLVTDTIDHLAATYPVYCVAAAGDTLRNMTMASEGTPPVEEYVAAIREKKPTVFVLSGGGNDILGEQFRRYIKEGVVPGPNTKPADYVEELLLTDLNSLEAMYRSIFSKLKASNPDLKILIHGYDYIIPLKVKNKGWLGRYMIEKGVGGPDIEQGHPLRKAVLGYILDQFNEKLRAVAAEFTDTVSYIETPKTVADNQWYDEIHPNGEGFALVAAKFKKRIAELMKTA